VRSGVARAGWRVGGEVGQGTVSGLSEIYLARHRG
jgi:hypothetical protein